MRLAVLVATIFLAACEREQRQLQTPVAQSGRHEVQGTRHEENAWSVSQGKHLFRWFNCVGCHAQGGGGMGVAHMDEKWRYGAEPDAVFASIMDGRPNGMPAYRGRISDDQAWQLVAYVRSMSALIAEDVRPGRADTLSGAQPEVRRDRP